MKRMTGLKDLGIMISRSIISKLPPLAIRSLLLTSKNLYTALSPFMETIYQTHFPGDLVDPNAPKNESYWTRRFLARTGASQVYVWGENSVNELCLSNSIRKFDIRQRGVAYPTRSEMLSRLGVKKIAISSEFLVALSLDNKVYFTNDIPRSLYPEDSDPRPPARLFECEGPNELILEVGTIKDVIFALSDTGRLYKCWVNKLFPTPSNPRFVEFYLPSAPGLPNTPRIISMTFFERYTACRLEDVGVVVYDLYSDPPEVVFDPRLFNSLEPDWDVVEVGVVNNSLVFVLANGRIYISEPSSEDGKNLYKQLQLYQDLSKPVDRAWCGPNEFMVRTRENELIYFRRPYTTILAENVLGVDMELVEDIDAARIHTIAMGRFHYHALLDDGTLYVSGTDLFWESGVGFPPRDEEFRDERWDMDMESEMCLYKPTKVNLEHVVLLAKFGESTAVIVMDPNEVHETDKEEAARLAMRDLLLTSKSICTALSPSMQTVYRAYSPNNPIEPEGRLGGPFYTRRLLAPTAASQVYVRGSDYNDMCLSDTPNQSSVYWPTRSEMLCRLGVKNFAVNEDSLVALSLEGKVYVTNHGERILEDDPPARLFELECPEVIVDMVANSGLITALSDTGRLYTWDIKDEEPPYKLVEVDLQSALGLENPPRFLTLSAGFGFVACIIEDVGVVVWRRFNKPKKNYTPVILPIPMVSNSLEPDWKVVDVVAGFDYLVLVLANGHIYTVDACWRGKYYDADDSLRQNSTPNLDDTDNKYLLKEPKLFNLPDVEQVWCGRNRFFALSRTKRLFEIKCEYEPDSCILDNDPIEFHKPKEVIGIDGARISTVAIGDFHNLFLMKDGTLYGNAKYADAEFLGLEPEGTMPQKTNLEHVVCIAAADEYSVAIVKDPNEVHEPDEAGATRTPTNLIEPNATNNGSYYTRRLLARTAASQVYVWGDNYYNGLCLWERHSRNIVHSPTRSQILSLLGVKKLAFPDSSIVALSLEGKVYVTDDGERILEGDLSPRLFELECPEVIVDMVANSGLITALSDTGRLYTWDIKDEEPPYKLVEVDLQSALGLPNQPRFLTLIARDGYVAFVEEDAGVLVWMNPSHPKEGYTPEVVPIPTVSKSLEPDWKVVDVGAGIIFLVLLLANGHIYTVQLKNRADGIIAQEPKRFNLPDAERVWCGEERFFVLSRTKSLFEIDSIYDSERPIMKGPIEFQEPREVEGIDGARISTVVMVKSHNLFLMEDGTLYVSRNGNPRYVDSEGFDLEPEGNISYEPQKIDLEHVVYIAAVDKYSDKYSVAIVKDPNEVHEPDEAGATRIPNDLIEPNATNNVSHYTRRLLARTAVSQVYVWSNNYYNGLRLWERPPKNNVLLPTRSQMLSRLGVKKLAFPGFSIVALSLEGKVYVTDDGERIPDGNLSPRLFELECPEVIVDVVADHGVITALSDTKRLYTWDIRYKEPPYKLVEVDFQSVLPKKPCFLTLSAGKGYVACVIEDVGVVVWRRVDKPKKNNTPEVVPIPTVSCSLEPDWKVVDVGAGNNFLVLLLANGHIYTVDLDNRADGIIAQEPKRFKLPDVERVWCGEDRFFVLSRTKSLFEIDSIYDSEGLDIDEPIEFQEPRKVEGIDGTRISAVAIGTFRELFLMEDGSLYVSARGGFSGREAHGLGSESDRPGSESDRLEPQGETPCKPQKLDLEHVVSVAACGSQCAVIIKDPKEVHETEAAS